MPKAIFYLPRVNIIPSPKLCKIVGFRDSCVVFLMSRRLNLGIQGFRNPSCLVVIINPKP